MNIRWKCLKDYRVWKADAFKKGSPTDADIEAEYKAGDVYEFPDGVNPPGHEQGVWENVGPDPFHAFLAGLRAKRAVMVSETVDGTIQMLRLPANNLDARALLETGIDITKLLVAKSTTIK